MKNTPIKIRNVTIQPGERINLALPTPEIYTCAPMHIPIHVFHGKLKGPTLLVCAGLHGDEMNGVAIVQKLINAKLLNKLKGTLIAIPAINIYGLINSTRTLPDRRDLEGSFPGTETGPYADRLAYMLTTEIFSLATHCIDLHTGEPSIYKLPQIHTNLDHEDAKQLAMAFRSPVVMHNTNPIGLLWQLDHERGIPTIRYEAGEALRLDEFSIKMGFKGIINVMRYLGMISPLKTAKDPRSLIVRNNEWVRASGSGLCQIHAKLSKHVDENDPLATIADPFGTVQRHDILAPVEGMVIAKNHIPIINEGEGIVQIAKTKENVDSYLANWKENNGEYGEEL